LKCTLRLAYDTIPDDRKTERFEAVDGGCEIADPDADMQVAGQSRNVRRPLRTLMPKESDVVVAVGEVVATGHGGNDFEAAGVSPLGAHGWARLHPVTGRTAGRGYAPSLGARLCAATPRHWAHGCARLHRMGSRHGRDKKPAPNGETDANG